MKLTAKQVFELMTDCMAITKDDEGVKVWGQELPIWYKIWIDECGYKSFHKLNPNNLDINWPDNQDDFIIKREDVIK